MQMFLHTNTINFRHKNMSLEFKILQFLNPKIPQNPNWISGTK